MRRTCGKTMYVFLPLNTHSPTTNPKSRSSPLLLPNLGPSPLFTDKANQSEGQHQDDCLLVFCHHNGNQACCTCKDNNKHIIVNISIQTAQERFRMKGGGKKDLCI